MTLLRVVLRAKNHWFWTDAVGVAHVTVATRHARIFSTADHPRAMWQYYLSMIIRRAHPWDSTTGPEHDTVPTGVVQSVELPCYGAVRLRQRHCTRPRLRPTPCTFRGGDTTTVEHRVVRKKHGGVVVLVGWWVVTRFGMRNSRRRRRRWAC